MRVVTRMTLVAKEGAKWGAPSKLVTVKNRSLVSNAKRPEFPSDLPGTASGGASCSFCTIREMDIEPSAESATPAASFPHDLFQLASDVAMVGAPPSDLVAAQIFQKHPLQNVFLAIAECEDGSKYESDLCTFLDRMFQTGPGQELMPIALPYARQGLEQGSTRVRQLACAQLGRAAAHFASSYDTEYRDGYFTILVDAIGDADSGVAAAAHDALCAVAEANVVTDAPGQAATCMMILQKLAPGVGEQNTAETRLRRHALAAAVASTSPGAADWANGMGLPRMLLGELDHTKDPLACVATMELIGEIVEKAPSSKAAQTLCAATLPTLASIATGAANSDESAGSGFAKARAATVGARLCASVSTATGQFPAATGGDSLLAALHKNLTLAVAGDGDKRDGEVACVAVASLCESAVALSSESSNKVIELVVLVVHLGLGGMRVPKETRVAALHAVASLFGAGEHHGRRSRLAAPLEAHEPVGVTSDASATIETFSREAVYDACAAHGATVGESVAGLLEKGGDSYLELRVATYRLVASLGRRPWFAKELAANDKAIALLTNPERENTPPGCRWRHEAVLGVLAAARAPEGETKISHGVASRLEAAAAGGPFGGGAGGVGSVAQVAVAQR